MSENEQPCDLALIGAGYWGKNLARNFHQLGVLRLLCDADEEALGRFNAEYDGLETCPDPEQVFTNGTITRVAIAAPAKLHYRLAKRAIEAGKDVFVEKPLCLDVAEAEELIRLADNRQRILMVGHLLQYHPCVRRLRELAGSGALGQLQYITSNRLNLGKIRREENALWSFAPHDLSVILSLAGDRLPKRVTCTGGSYLTSGIADTTLMAMRFDGGVGAHVYVSWLNPFKEQKLTVIGSEGMLVFDDTLPWEQKLLLFRDHLAWGDGGVPEPNKSAGEPVEVPEDEPLRCECEHFLEATANRTAPRTDGREGLRVLRTLHAAQASLDRDGEPVDIR